MRILKLAVPAFVLSTGLLITSATTFAKPEDTKKTKKPCITCHTNAKGGKELTAAGKHYKEKGTLEGFEDKK
jgi:hypothetical protein